MLAAQLDLDQEGITVPYPPLFDDMRRNHGFVDLRGHPDLADKIPECSQSPALKELLVFLSQPDALFFTLGCDLGSHEEPDSDVGARYVAGGYIQLMHTSYADRYPEEYNSLGHAIARRLNDDAINYDWIARFVHSFVDFNLDEFSVLTSSLWIWFYATAQTPEDALASREVFLRKTREVLSGVDLKKLHDEWLVVEEATGSP